MHTLPRRRLATQPGWQTLAVLSVAITLFSGAPRLPAQDVAVGEPVCVIPTPPPDKLPQARGRLRPDYPREMRQTDEIGYVIITRYLDAQGTNRHLQAYGTHTPFQRAVEDELTDWKMTPARQQGVAIDSLIWLPVIFNPKSAAPETADATPRLLAVAPVITKKKPTPNGQPPIVRMKLGLDATGAILRAEPEESGVSPATLTAIRESLQAWRFAPARKGGLPVAAEISLPVICQPPPKTNQAKMIPPKPLKRVQPEYPLVLRRFGLQGDVKIVFEIDTDGSVRNPTIIQTDNPAFDEPAIDAILQWKYAPATSDGQPVKTRAQQELRFELMGGATRDAFTIDRQGDQSKLPPEFRYDTPPKVRGVQVPVYPAELRRADARGQAKVVMLIDPQGRVAQVKVVEADHPEFGLALAAAAEGFRFDPALKNGRPVPNLLAFEQDFNDRVLPDDKADRLLALERKHPERIVSLAVLDTPLKPVSRRAPVFPVTASAGADRGSAMIEFLVDEDGRARLPRIVEASEPAFGYAAVQAVAAWWFEPPKKGGKPVVTRARVPVDFSPPKAAPAAPAKPTP